jgi:hypothetical protein
MDLQHWLPVQQVQALHKNLSKEGRSSRQTQKNIVPEICVARRIYTYRNNFFIPFFVILNKKAPESKLKGSFGSTLFLLPMIKGANDGSRLLIGVGLVGGPVGVPLPLGQLQQDGHNVLIR